jgi:WD40 repeat protein
MYLASLQGNGTVVVYCADTHEKLGELRGHLTTVTCLAFLSAGTLDGRTLLASGSCDSTARIWDVTNCAEIARFDHDGYSTVRDVQFNNAGDKLLTRNGFFSKAGEVLTVWDTNTRQRVFSKRMIETGICYFEVDRIIYNTFDESLLIMYELDELTGETSLRTADFPPADTAYFWKSANCDLFALCRYGEPDITIWSSVTGKQILRTDINYHPLECPRRVIFSPHGRKVAFSWDLHTIILDLGTFERMTLEHAADGSCEGSFNLDASRFAIGKSKRIGAEQCRLLQIFDTCTQKVTEIDDVGGIVAYGGQDVVLM